MRQAIVLWFLIMTFNILSAGDYPFRFQNEVYDQDIRSVTLEVNNLPTNFPILNLHSGQYVLLKFDDLLNEERRLYYRVIHCTKDWEPSGISEIEAIGGFNDERLRNYDYSINTKVPFIHYWQRFPNKDTQLKISGNYLIVIYEDNIDYPLLTRRLVVTENKVGVDIQGIFPADVENIRYKQELQVAINFEKFKMRNPVDEVQIVMLQNENWNVAVNAKPSFFSGNLLKFNRLRTFEFWGLAEYRQFDTRSLMRLGRHVNFIDRRNDGTDILLMTDESRQNKVHLAFFDFNGKFFIDNFERLGGRSATQALDEYTSNIQADASLRQSLRDSLVSSISKRNALLDSEDRAEERDIRSDYTHVTFLLDAETMSDDQDVYVLGSMNNWLPAEEFKLKYDAKRDMLSTEAILKQGYYNYYYGIVKKDQSVDYLSMEGSWNETENDYQALVYYRGLGDLYDRVIGYNTYNTNARLLNVR
jgi:hypothetical protein